MKGAIEFLKKYGISDAKQLVSMGSGICEIDDGISFHTSDLKRLVEAHEIIELFKSLEQAKIEVEACEKSGHSQVLVKLDVGVGYIWLSRVKQAILDVESCQ